MSSKLTPTPSWPVTDHQGTGFDSPVFGPKDDHLNRWPLARQIYNVATNGPAGWSARIGVYGEWGTGKTSVLKFVSALAEEEGHIVVWFDPWGYSSKPDLWHAFVMKCCDTIEGKLGGITAAGEVRRKSYLKKGRDLLATVTKKIPGDTGSAITGGLDLLTGAFSFGRDDLKKLHADLKGKRVVVLIDDLDRTAAELVPEILFALKEVMDIPGFSFVCGFDPVVVGKVFRASHRGFGDGQKFLEKIIDYPIWLPPATAEGLMKIALADAAKHCSFVPTDDVRQVIPLLPQNPRAIRQFIRHLSLLKHQIERHHEYELRWPVILAATVIKVRHPKLADPLLNDPKFWQEIAVTEMVASHSNESEKVPEEVTKHIAKCEKDHSVALSSAERDQVSQGLTRIVEKLSLWSGDGVELIRGQMSITEAPQAVTWKEFEDCLELCKTGVLAEQLKEWIVNHAKDQHCGEARVASELTRAALERYRSELHQADNVFVPRQQGSHKRKAKFLLRALEVLVLKMGDALPALKSREWLPVSDLMKDMVSLANAVSAVHRELWPRTKTLQFSLVKKWQDDLKTLGPAVRSIHPNHSGRLEGQEREVAIELNVLFNERLCEAAAGRFDEAGFVDRVSDRFNGDHEFRELMLDAKSALWTTFRPKVLATFKKANSNMAMRENAHAFLVWIDQMLRKPQHHDQARLQELAGDSEIMAATWDAATVAPFAGKYAYRLKELPAALDKLGVKLTIPPWWQPAIDETAALYEKEKTQRSEAPSGI
ncbi:P-loop NTPase fold protein [Prosthecobacter sp.]|uniref:KAP family P-loop NTPase fold protein n=1 Tax=Prosthecobacter sp. TaxID=1965333 RepID=UPI002ABB98D5|nr:P-loop NTPase fold protein [Prosthecobacter sp.]MDZ4401270.1 P-loop NTPase fold protein [Prosthecobacter sp.]